MKQHEHLAAEAAAFAVRAHGQQLRTGTQFPYFVHPLGVGMILRFTYPDNEVLEAAGYLHDVIEDTEFDRTDLNSRFGSTVTQLVVAVTRDGPGYGDRLLEHIAREPLVARLKVADVIDNMRDTIRGLDKGHDVWARFSAGRAKVSYWTAIRDSAMRSIPDEPLVTQLDHLLLNPQIINRFHPWQTS